MHDSALPSYHLASQAFEKRPGLTTVPTCTNVFVIELKLFEMYFDYDKNSEDSDDDLYKGELPEDFEEVKEEKCKKCEANEKKLGADMPKTSMTKKEFKTLRRALYKKMVDEGLVKYFVEMLTALCPNTIQDLSMLGRLLANPKAGEIKDLAERCRVVNKIAQRIRELYANIGQTVPLQTRLDAIIQETLEIKRMRKEESRLSRKGPTQSILLIRDHICNPNCHWCQLHCDSFAKLKVGPGKLCDCQCVMLQPPPVRNLSKC